MFMSPKKIFLLTALLCISISLPTLCTNSDSSPDNTNNRTSAEYVACKAGLCGGLVGACAGGIAGAIVTGVLYLKRKMCDSSDDETSPVQENEQKIETSIHVNATNN